MLRSGEKNTVFVALDGGHFEPREVQLGARADNDSYEVLSGLKEGERVVTSGQFMLDSESQLREAIQKMLNPNATPAPVAVAKHLRISNRPRPSPQPNRSRRRAATSAPCPSMPTLNTIIRASVRFAG